MGEKLSLSIDTKSQVRQATPEEIARAVDAFCASPEGQAQILKSQKECDEAMRLLRKARQLTTAQIRRPRSPKSWKDPYAR